jgi:hypothetical protein
MAGQIDALDKNVVRIASSRPKSGHPQRYRAACAPGRVAYNCHTPGPPRRGAMPRPPSHHHNREELYIVAPQRDTSDAPRPTMRHSVASQSNACGIAIQRARRRNPIRRGECTCSPATPAITAMWALSAPSINAGDGSEAAGHGGRCGGTQRHCRPRLTLRFLTPLRLFRSYGKQHYI